jgi:hypothetical protein
MDAIVGSGGAARLELVQARRALRPDAAAA